jgi:peptidoglycan-N-acetylglucosamine deacetylase
LRPQASKPLASLSLDLDNKWSYMKTHGDAGWEALPSYLPVVVPRVLGLLRERKLTITFFVVGLDAEQEENRDVLRSIAADGHEIGNHSFHHEPWLHRYSPSELETEIAKAESSIERATGQRPIGFRGPGFSLSAELIELLTRRGYLYDASTFPTFLGPLARAYYFMKSRIEKGEQREQRSKLFGSLAEGLRPAKAYRWQTSRGELIEIPVTTMPGFKLPIHVSYLLYLSSFSAWLALFYFRVALLLCRTTGTQPSLLLHPLDFLGCDDIPDLGFFPAMHLKSSDKISFVTRVLDMFAENFKVLTVVEHARALQSADLASLAPNFP